MDISAAALPPQQPAISDAARKHPRFRQYMAYRSAMSCKLLTADSFDLWLHTVEEAESYRDVVFHTQPGATMPQGWYKHRFAPGHELIERLGPFGSQAEARDA